MREYISNMSSIYRNISYIGNILARLIKMFWWLQEARNQFYRDNYIQFRIN